ncbi:hypothetical protein [Saccharopolyspora taberi]|uniref:Endonuclease/exonuclease/phosphatase domain-containing protein n=1 Tax=Saccharopolyspora taberi TaxID=60895 RepID=A0ABN3VKR6_9PSEU
MITVMSVNALNLYGSDGEQAQKRFAGIEALIRDRDPDLIAVQEIIADGENRAATFPAATVGVRRLAQAVDRCCEIDGQPAVAVGGIIHHTAVLWRDCAKIRPVSGTLQRLERELAGMWPLRRGRGIRSRRPSVAGRFSAVIAVRSSLGSKRCNATAAGVSPRQRSGDLWRRLQRNRRGGSPDSDGYRTSERSAPRTRGCSRKTGEVFVIQSDE